MVVHSKLIGEVTQEIDIPDVAFTLGDFLQHPRGIPCAFAAWGTLATAFVGIEMGQAVQRIATGSRSVLNGITAPEPNIDLTACKTFVIHHGIRTVLALSTGAEEPPGMQPSRTQPCHQLIQRSRSSACQAGSHKPQGRQHRRRC